MVLEKESVPTAEFFALLPGLKSLTITSLNAVSRYAQLNISDMLRSFASNGTKLTELDIAACNVTSRQFNDILDGMPTLRTLKLGAVGSGSHCPDGWSRVLANIATRINLSITKLELRILVEHRTTSSEGSSEHMSYKWLSALGKDYDWNEYSENPTRYITKVWRSPEGFQQYKLGSTTSFMFGKHAIRSGLKIMLGNLLTKEEVDALNIEA